MSSQSTNSNVTSSNVVTPEEPQKDRLIRECMDKFNHLCLLYHSEVVRLVGFEDDGLDYYYIVKNIKGEQFSSSMVGWCQSLKEVSFYDNIDNSFKTSGCPEEKEFILKDVIRQNENKIKCVDCGCKFDPSAQGYIAMEKEAF